MLFSLTACNNSKSASTSEKDSIYSIYEYYLANGGTMTFDQWLVYIQGKDYNNIRSELDNLKNQDISKSYFRTWQANIQFDGAMVEDGEWKAYAYKLDNVSLINEVKAISFSASTYLCVAFYSSETLFDTTTFMGGVPFTNINELSTINNISIPINAKVAVLGTFWALSHEFKFSVNYSNIDAKQLDDIDHLSDLTIRKSSMKFGAHQGYRSIAPANTIPAYKLAGIYGWDYLWLAQIRRSIDGTWYVIHDGIIDETTDGSGNIHLLTDDYLSTVHIDQGVNVDHFSQEELRIPTLEDAIQICNLYGMGACFRITDMPLAYDTDSQKSLWDGFVNIIKSYKKEGEIFSADSTETLELLRQVSGENWEVCLFLSNEATADDYISAFNNSNLSGNLSVLLYYENVNLEAVKKLHLADIKVYGFKYTDMSETEITNWAKWGVDICQNAYKNHTNTNL